MNKLMKVVSVSVIALGAIAISGCSTSKIEESVGVLNGKVDMLSADVQSLHSEVLDAKSEAQRANARIDNLEQQEAMHYRK